MAGRACLYESGRKSKSHTAPRSSHSFSSPSLLLFYTPSCKSFLLPGEGNASQLSDSQRGLTCSPRRLIYSVCEEKLTLPALPRESRDFSKRARTMIAARFRGFLLRCRCPCRFLLANWKTRRMIPRHPLHRHSDRRCRPFPGCFSRATRRGGQRESTATETYGERS